MAWVVLRKVPYSKQHTVVNKVRITEVTDEWVRGEYADRVGKLFSVKRHPGNQFYLGGGSSKTKYSFVEESA